MAMSTFTKSQDATHDRRLHFRYLFTVSTSLLFFSNSANGFAFERTSSRSTVKIDYLDSQDLHGRSSGFRLVGTKRGFMTLRANIWDENDDNNNDMKVQQESMTRDGPDKLLQAELNKITSADDLPLFSLDFDPKAYEDSKVPLPAFTASLIFLWSTLFTIYLFYIGIHGFD